MTASKSDKTPKVMDVARPGKSVPSASAKPIIVTNRPMLRRDPMMTTPDGLEKDVSEETSIPVARAGKPVVIVPLASMKEAAKPADGKTPAIAPEAAIEPAAPSTAPSLPPKADDEDIKEDVVEEQAPVADKETIAGEVGQEALESSGLDAPVEPIESEPVIEEPAEPATAELKPADETPPEEPAHDTAKLPELTATTPEAEDTNTPKTDADDKTAEAASSEPKPGTNDEPAEATTDSDAQLAPNQTLDEAKRKEDEAKAARTAELEQLIASKRFYLPIRNVEQRRGVNRSLLILVVVVALALVWADVALDAGIVRVGGVHALTHFFSH